jgi:hypothetical protein
MLDKNCCFKTVKGYVESINTLFKLRGFAIPIDLSDKQNMCTRLIDEIEREETIAKQQSPLTKEMFVNMGKLAAILPKNLANSVLRGSNQSIPTRRLGLQKQRGASNQSKSP